MLEAALSIFDALSGAIEALENFLVSVRAQLLTAIDPVVDDFGRVGYPVRHFVPDVRLKVIDAVHGRSRKLPDVLLSPHAALWRIQKSDARPHERTSEEKPCRSFNIDFPHVWISFLSRELGAHPVFRFVRIPVIAFGFSGGCNVICGRRRGFARSKPSGGHQTDFRLLATIATRPPAISAALTTGAIFSSLRASTPRETPATVTPSRLLCGIGTASDTMPSISTTRPIQNRAFICIYLTTEDSSRVAVRLCTIAQPAPAYVCSVLRRRRPCFIRGCVALPQLVIVRMPKVDG